jgi:hypothetical protein
MSSTDSDGVSSPAFGTAVRLGPGRRWRAVASLLGVAVAVLVGADTARAWDPRADQPASAYAAWSGRSGAVSPTNLLTHSTVAREAVAGGQRIVFRACYGLASQSATGKLWQRWSEAAHGDWFFLYAEARPGGRYDLYHYAAARGATRVAAGLTTGRDHVVETPIFADRAGRTPVVTLARARIDDGAPAGPLNVLGPSPCGRSEGLLQSLALTIDARWLPAGSAWKWKATTLALSQAVESAPADALPTFYADWATPPGAEAVALSITAVAPGPSWSSPGWLPRPEPQARALAFALIFPAAVAGAVVGATSLVGARLARWPRGPVRWSASWRGLPTAHLGALAAIAVVALALRVSHVSVPMRDDESYTFLHYIAQPLWRSLRNYSVPNNHVFHTLLAHLATRVFGEAEWAVRLPALLAGLAMVPATYLVGRAFYNRDVGLVAASAVAASSILVEYSTNARGYTIVGLLFLGQLWLAARLAVRPTPAAWLAFAGAGALGLWAIPTMVYPIALAGIWLALMAIVQPPTIGRWRQLGGLARALAATGLLAAVLYLPIMIVTGSGSLGGNWFVQSRPVPEVLAHYGLIGRHAWHQLTRDAPTPLVLLAVAGLAAALVRLERPRAFRVPLFVPAFVVVVAAIFIQRGIAPTRIWLFLHPLVYLVACSALGALRPGWRSTIATIGSVVAALAIAVSLLGNDSIRRSKEDGLVADAEPVALYLAAGARSGDRWLTTFPPEYPILYYLHRHRLPSAMMYSPIELSERVLIVTSVAWDQSPDDVLAYWSIYRQPWLRDYRLLHELPSARIYEARKPGP